jgi:ABC-type Fe3+/spermidine/putrescine transport system ATPase subunit
MGMINILETTVVEKREKHLLLKWKDQQLNVQARGGVSRGDPILLGIRPEEVIISRQPAQGNIATGTNTFQGSLVKDLAQGYDHLLTFTLSPQKEPGAQLMVRIPHPIFQKMALVVGQERYLSIDPADIHIIQRAKG